jgi:hypothetical protein
MGGEALTLLAGAGSGFLFKLIGTIVQGSMDITKAQTASKIELQEKLDDSHDRADKRGGVGASWVRKLIVVSILMTMVYFPFVIAFTDVGVSVPVKEGWWIFSKTVYQQVNGMWVDASLIDALLLIIGYYFGGASLGKK